MSTPAEAFQEAHERHEAAGEHSPRWVPLAAAILALLAAISGFVSNLRATAASTAKNDAIIATARSSDAYSQYQAGRIKYYVYQAAIDAGTARDPAKLAAVAQREKGKGPALLDKARGLEAQAEEHNVASEHRLRSHEILEVSTTLFEVAIVLISITALVGSRLLPVAGGIAAALGLAIFLVGVFR